MKKVGFALVATFIAMGGALASGRDAASLPRWIWKSRYQVKGDEA